VRLATVVPWSTSCWPRAGPASLQSGLRARSVGGERLPSEADGVLSAGVRGLRRMSSRAGSGVRALSSLSGVKAQINGDKLCCDIAATPCGSGVADRCRGSRSSSIYGVKSQSQPAAQSGHSGVRSGVKAAQGMARRATGT
jgi:hypothetical protein